MFSATRGLLGVLKDFLVGVGILKIAVKLLIQPNCRGQSVLSDQRLDKTLPIVSY